MTEREWREASDMQASMMNVAIVIAVAAGLRFWSLGSGLPYAVGEDERTLLTGVVRMMKSGGFHPPVFDTGGLLYYLHLPLFVLQFLLDAIAGRWTSLAQASPEDFNVAARALTALIGTGTVLLVYQIGLRWGARHALLGAGLLAVMPLHVVESHVARADVPATFLTTFALLFALMAHERATPRMFAWAGAAAGLAAATRYSAGLVLLAPLLAAWMTLHAASRRRCALAATGAAVAAFLLGAPYTLLDLPAFLNGVSARAYANHIAAPGSAPAWRLALDALRASLGWPATILMTVGLALGVVRAVKGPGRVRWTVLLTFGGAWLAWLSVQSLPEPRHVLPLLPVACILAAIAVLSGVSLLRRFDIPRATRRVLIVTLTVAALLPPLVSSISLDRQRMQRDTRGVAYEWILGHVPAGSRMVVERDSLQLPEGRYRARAVGRVVGRSLEEYLQAGVTHFVMSSDSYGLALTEPHRYPAEFAAYRRFFDQVDQMFVVAPDRGRPGPEVRVLRVRPSPTPAQGVR